MKKTSLLLVLITALGLGGYLLYRTYMAGLVAKAVTSESLPKFIPKRFQSKVETIRAPLNDGAKAMVEKMHASDIPLDQVLRAVDNVTEQQVYSFLDELHEQDPASTNEVFDIAKKHFSAGFNLELFRQPFNKHFSLQQVKNAAAYAEMNRKSNDVDISTAKTILKKIIIEKEKEVRHDR
jgi:hypothetical protein